MRLPLLNEKMTKSPLSEQVIDMARLGVPRSSLAIIQSVGEVPQTITYALVRTERAKGRVWISHSDLFTTPADSTPEALAQLIAEQVRLWGTVDACTLALDESSLAFRAFTMPFGNPEHLATILPNEFAEVSPLPVAQFSFAPYPAIAQADNSFLVGVSATGRASCASLQRAFSDAGLPLVRLCPFMAVMASCAAKQANTAPTALISHTAERTVLAMATAGSVIARLLHTAHVAEPEASSGTLFEPSPENLPPVPATGNPQSLANKLRFLPGIQNIAHIWLASGSLTTGQPMANALEEESGVATHCLSLQDMAAHVGQIMVTQRHSGLPNFLTGDLAPGDAKSGWYTKATTLCLTACVLMGLACFTQWMETSRAERALRPVQQALFKEYREILPEMPATTPPAQMQRILEARLNEWNTAQRATADATSVLHLLNAVHNALPSSFGVTVENFALGKSTMTLSVTAPTFQTAEMVRESLSRLATLKDVQLKGVVRETGKERVRFEIEASLRFADL